MPELEALNEFLLALRLCSKRFALYPEGHPARKAFLLELKDKLDKLLLPEKSLWLGVTTKALRLQDGTYLTDKLHEEMARYLHGRRIQSLEIQAGLTEEELALFLKFLAKSQKADTFSSEELQVSPEEELHHIKIQWLDYSLLLAEHGEEIKDVWSYLFDQALKSRQSQHLDQAASYLIKSLERSSVCELASDERQWPLWPDFFSSLREKKVKSFKPALSAVVKNILTRPEQLTSPVLEEKFQGLLEDFDEETLATCLSEAFRDDPSFDASKLGLWFRLTRSKKHGLMATFFERNLETRLTQWPAAFLRDKFTRLIQGYSINPYPEAYYQAFLSLLKKIPEESRRQLDRESLWRHEISLHLFLLGRGQEPEAMFDSLSFLSRNLSRIMEARDFPLLREFHYWLSERQAMLTNHEDYLPTLKRLTAFIEEKILKEEDFPEQDYFVASLKRSALGLNYYLQTIFGEGRVSPAILKLFFRFFLEHIFYFDLNLDEKAGDRAFLEKMIVSLAEVDSPASFVSLKNIFNFSEADLRRKVLLAMQRLSTFDENFLWSHLLERPLSWQKEALLLLKKKPASLERALKMLLVRSSPFGIKNKQIIEAVQLVGEMGLIEALPYLQALARKPFFWNYRLRKEVRKVLRFLNG